MKEIWKYLSIRTRNALSVKRVMSLTMLLVGIFHVGLIVLFSVFRIYPLAVINIFSVLLYIGCYIRAYRGKNLLQIFNLAYIEIIVHAVIAALLMGTESGFSLYMIAMLPLGYYATYNFNSRKQRTNPMFYVVISGLAFCFVRIVGNYIEPLYSYGNSQIDKVVYMINYFVTVAAVVFFMSTLLNQIQILEELRTQQNKRLEKISKTDPLTGLANRRSLEERYKQAELLNEEYVLIMGDIDDFKKVNDTYGHNVGDEVLKTVADVFGKSVREEDIVCRWGGEEILIFAPKCEKCDGVSIGERILKTVREIEIPAGKKMPIHITMTIGVAVSGEGGNFSEVVKVADERLYHGKQSGKNRVVDSE